MKNRVKPGVAALANRLRARFGIEPPTTEPEHDRSLFGRGKGRTGNGGHPSLLTLHRDVARAELRRQRRKSAGRWAP